MPVFKFDPDDPYELFIKQQMGLLEEELLGVSRRFVASVRTVLRVLPRLRGIQVDEVLVTEQLQAVEVQRSNEIR